MGKYLDEKRIEEFLRKYEIDDDKLVNAIKSKIESKKIRLDLSERENLFNILVQIFESTRINHIDINEDEKIFIFINEIEVRVNYKDKVIIF
ncbi:MAG: hypothetical protein QW156_04040 [Candidatus Aenigmatarchaeota archaeon]